MNPNVVVNQQPMQTQNPWYKGSKLIKLIFLILGIVILVELGLGVKKLLVPFPASQPSLSVRPISDAQISLLSDKKVYKLGDKVIVDIKLSTSGHNIAGADIILSFDPKTLQASSSSFAKGKIFSDYPQINVDSQSGLITLSGVAGLNKKFFNGIGSFGTITFTTKRSGQPSLNISFTKGSTADTNVFDAISNEDVLGKVYNLTLTVQ
ncbi:MAG: cohesin domain-containing protein [Patescibacteria group bacterium]